MEQFEQQQSGFTLMEVLIVVAILGILSSLVVVNVLGFVGRGSEQAYAVDERNLQTAVAAFYADKHIYDAVNGWNEASSTATPDYKFPTGSGLSSALYPGASVKIGGQEVKILTRFSDGSHADASDVADAAIWMTLLVNEPGSGTGIAPVADTKDNSAPLDDEHGMYINKVPESCSRDYNSCLGKGTYTWIVGNYGRVYGIFQVGGVWYVGFKGANR